MPWSWLWKYPFRQARSLLRHEIGDEISYRTIHRWAQEEGKKLREEEEARQETVFGRVEKVRNDGKEREIVVLEVDGTLLHSQEKGEDNFEAKLVIKNIDLMLCRRFKGRGMSWSRAGVRLRRAGVQNLLKLRLLRYDRKDWKAYWRRRAN